MPDETISTTVEPAMTAGDRDKRFDVFVVCAEEDRGWTEGFLLTGLRDAGVRFLDESQFPLGPPLLKLFADAVEQSDRVMLVVTPAFLADSRAEFVKWLALHFGEEQSTWPVLTLVLEPVDRLPPELALGRHLDLTDENEWEAGLNTLVEDLNRAPTAPLSRPPCPYPGLLSYTGEDGDRFPFRGRDAEIAEIVERLRVHPVLAVIGTSGSGKSSLLHAGVRPRLQDEYEVVSLRPGLTPRATLAATVERARSSSRPVVLIIDQFEELFTLSDAGGWAHQEMESFCDDLLDLFESSAPLGVRGIIAIRADYYPQLMTCPLWVHIREHRFELLPLQGESLRAAIREPASSVGVHIESALVEALLHDSEGEPGSLPLVQETLVSLWSQLRRRYLPLSAYDALILPGRAYGEPPRTGLQVALARHADATMSSLDEADQLTARRIFVQLVQLMDGRADVRRPQRRDQLDRIDSSAESIDRVLLRLIDARLVTPTADEATADSRETQLDLAHEALISGWPSLREWLTEQRAAEMVRRRLEASAGEWARLGRGDGGLLDEVELAEARTWLDGPDAAELGVSPTIADFVTKSSSTLNAARERKARQNRMFRILSAALAILLVAVAIAAVLAVQSRNEAEERRQMARSGELGLSAGSLPPEQLDRALLLGVEALELRRTPLAVEGALASLNANPGLLRLLHAELPQLAVASTADGGTALTGGQDGVVRVWDLNEDDPVRQLGALGGEIRSLALSPDDSTVAASSSVGTIGLWDLATGGRLPWTLAGSTDGTEHEGSVRSLAFSADGSLLATAGQDGLVIVRDAGTGSVQWSAGEYRDWLNAVTFTPDGTLLVGAGGRTEGRSVDRRILLWDAATGELVAELPGHDDAVRALAVSPDGTLLASAGAEGTIKVWSLPVGGLLRQLEGHQDRVFDLEFSPDGTLLASAGRDHTVRLWDAATGVPATDPLLGHGDSVRGLAFAGTGRVVSVGNDSRILLWNTGETPQARLATPLPDQTATTRAVAVDADATLMATGDDTGRVVLRRTTDGEPTGVVVDMGAPVSGVALGPDSMLVTATYDGRLRVWDAMSGEPRTEVRETGEGSLVVAVSPNGRSVVTGGETSLIRVWDERLEQTAELQGHRNWVRALAFVPPQPGQEDSEGPALVSAGADGVALLWESMTTATEPRALGERSGLMESLAVSPDGRAIATGNVEGQVILWDASERDASPFDRPKLAAHDGTVTGIAFSPDGDLIVTTDSEGTVRLWPADSGLEPLGVLGRVGPLSDVVMPSEAHAFTVGEGGPARWALEADEWRRIACEVAGRNLSPEEAERYGFQAPPNTCLDDGP